MSVTNKASIRELGIRQMAYCRIASSGECGGYRGKQYGTRYPVPLNTCIRATTMLQEHMLSVLKIQTGLNGVGCGTACDAAAAFVPPMCRMCPQPIVWVDDVVQGPLEDVPVEHAMESWSL